MRIKLKGRDGVSITIPDGYIGLQGRDGHMVAIPPGGLGLQGRDGRMVAIRVWCEESYPRQLSLRRGSV